MKKTLSFAFAVLIIAATPLEVRSGPANGFSDVPQNYWAEEAINYVAADRDWLRDYGNGEFRPEELLTRRQEAHALVLAFAPDEEPDPQLVFTDLPPTDPSYRYANVAVKLRWMTAENGAFRPDDPVTKESLDGALTRALGLKRELRGLRKIQTADGTRLSRPPGFPQLVLAHELGLHFNHPTDAEARELLPSTNVLRADAAYGLFRAATAVGTWRMSSLERYRSVVLATMTPEQLPVAEFALAHVGYPYVWGGEWNAPTANGYCCGGQPQGGFDCSGFAWWVLREPTDSWDNTAYRPYQGWPLPERRSRDMAAATRKKIGFGKLQPLDLMFFAGETGDVNHAGLYLGSEWMVHSSGGGGGVSLGWLDDGYYRERFTWARRLIA
ncbi:MAG: NlpC/P60 family protein [Actinomycetota bacterium]